MSWSALAVTKPCSRPPSMLTGYAPRLQVSFPLQCTTHPLIDEADHQDAEEYHHGKETGQADFFEHDGPREKKGNFQVEQDEQDGDQVVADVELHARVFKCFEAAFGGGKFFAIRAVRGPQAPCDH